MADKLDKNILNTINKYLDVVRSINFSFDAVWLFGSYAENRANQDSDIDIAVVMPDAGNKFYKELELTKCRRNIDTRIEPHIINSADLDSPLYKEITSKGIKIV